MASSSAPSSAATAIAARAFSTLWRPGMFRVISNGSPSVRTTRKAVLMPVWRTFSARRSASSLKP